MASKVQIKVENYEYSWKVPNWVMVQNSRELVNNQKILIKTGNPLSFQSTWEIGWMMHPKKVNIIVPFWKLIKVDGNTNELQATINFRLKTNCGTHLWEDVKVARNFKVDEEKCILGKCKLSMGYSSGELASYYDENGAATFLANLSIKIPHTSSGDYFNMFLTQMSINLADVYNDSSSSDLKIITSDGKELRAHKLILKARCPVFASMFRSQFSENTTGVVHVEDVSWKTMEILLHFFYSGQLLGTWSDPDTIVEFTYAAGKYEMTQVLQMLDSTLGFTEIPGVDLLLLNIVNKLSLRNAEKRLLKLVKEMTMKIDSADEFLALFNNNCTCNHTTDNNMDDNNLLVKVSDVLK